MENRTLLKPGTLRAAAITTTVDATRSGSLQPIATAAETVEDHGVSFVLRTLCQRRAPKPRRDPSMVESERPNPFLPYDPNLFVADVSPTHLCLLNKYTVIENHLLLVTRAFEHQEQWLTQQDFDALSTCMVEFEGLAFYNGGAAAGASQPHKHLQYVPYPMAASGPNVPMEALLASACVGQIETALDLPFVHAVTRFDRDDWQNPRYFSECLTALYGEMMAAVGIDPRGIGEGGRQSCAYNLLATRDWMLIIPRRRDAVDGISVNGLGFAGHLLARDRTQADFIARFGPLNILQQTGIPRHE